MPRKVLILGGTQEARMLANRLVHIGMDVTSSFAGVTENPALPEGKIRSGGFGGVEGLRQYLANEQIDILVDATHPFAAVMSAHAAEAAPHVLRLERGPWSPLPQDRWIDVAGNEAALAALPMDARVMLTIGRNDVAVFVSRSDLSGVARMIEFPSDGLPKNWRLILERPPFSVADELALMKQHSITHLVTKNAGGRETAAKLEAARDLALTVVMIARPQKPDVDIYPTVDAIAAAIASR
jgi:precorrin-6A/cobalt-precorrin-6A reductase